MSIAEKILRAKTDYDAVYAAALDADETEIYNAGQLSGKDIGKQEEWSKIWDLMQNLGKRGNYTYAFYGCSTIADSLYPKYDFNFTKADYFMRDTGGTSYSNKRIDLVERLAECGVKMNFSNCTNLTYTFYNSCITHIPEIDCRNAGITQGYLLISQITHTVDKLILKDDGSQHLGDTFGYGVSLENVIVEGVIGKNSKNVAFDTHWSKNLSKASIMSLINALSPTITGGTAIFSKTAINNAFGINVDDQTTWPEGSEYYTLRHSKDNWTISYS